MALFGSYRFAYIGYPAKRLVDIVVSGLALAVLAPLLLIIGVAIKLGSEGPALFRQQRLGLHEQPFEILKFRSMQSNAASTGPAFTVPGDSRVTSVGRILRKTSLDELPQLINVLFGQMSLFGPRPFVGFELETWSSEQRQLRASVRPGLSGLAQTCGRSTMTPERQLDCDLEYVRQCGLWGDCILAVRTLWLVLAGRGTN